jgi:hypothetical protein
MRESAYKHVESSIPHTWTLRKCISKTLLSIYNTFIRILPAREKSSAKFFDSGDTQTIAFFKTLSKRKQKHPWTALLARIYIDLTPDLQDLQNYILPPIRT